MNTNPTLFLVDDHPMVREGLAQLLATEGYTLSGQAGSSREALAHPSIASSGMVLVDLSLGDQNGFALITQLSKLDLPVLVYSMHESSLIIQRALDAGAKGYVTKREAGPLLIAAIRAVLAGEHYLSSRAAAALRETAPLDELNGQQRNIYQLLGQGYSNEEIAQKLNISVRTLESYCVRIMNKLGVSGIKALRRQAIQDAARVNI